MKSALNQTTFWKKLNRHASTAGKSVIEKVLWLYFASQRPETPKWAKGVIVGALAYFVLPVDAIPDFIPITGYTDDLTVLAAAIATVSMYINDDVKKKASEMLGKWFD